MNQNSLAERFQSTVQDVATTQNTSLGQPLRPPDLIAYRRALVVDNIKLRFGVLEPSRVSDTGIYQGLNFVPSHSLEVFGLHPLKGSKAQTTFGVNQRGELVRAHLVVSNVFPVAFRYVLSDVEQEALIDYVEAPHLRLDCLYAAMKLFRSEQEEYDDWKVEAQVADDSLRADLQAIADTHRRAKALMPNVILH